MTNRIALTIVLIFLSSRVDGGSKCPPRVHIYPCICNEIVQQNSQAFTLVTCSVFPTTNDFDKIPRLLSRMLIDRLVITDYNPSSVGEITLPERWAETLRIRELEFQNVKFSPIIFQNKSLQGQEIALEKLVLRNIFIENSTLCGSCGHNVASTTKSTKYPYNQVQVQRHLFVHLGGLSSMINLREIDLSWNQFESIGEYPFPSQLTNLQDINLSHNRISHIDQAVFAPFMNLRVVKLSHNRITTLPPNMFRTDMSLIDFSNNEIRSIPEHMLDNITLHSEILFADNHLQTFPLNIWMSAARLAMLIDVSGNFFTCDCSIAWIRSHVSPSCRIIGNCATPREMEMLSLKEAALNQKCQLGKQSNSTSATL